MIIKHDDTEYKLSNESDKWKVLWRGLGKGEWVEGRHPMGYEDSLEIENDPVKATVEFIFMATYNQTREEMTGVIEQVRNALECGVLGDSMYMDEWCEWVKEE